MKKTIIIFLLYMAPCALFSQVPVRVHGLARFSTNASAGIPMSAVDTSYEKLVFAPIVNVTYDITRPNKCITVSGDISFSMNDISTGKSGIVKFTLVTGSETIILNGKLNTALPTSAGTFSLHYSNTAGVINWN